MVEEDDHRLCYDSEVLYSLVAGSIHECTPYVHTRKR